ncbi:ROK family protein [Microbacterium sp. cf332]|uniref:ROK family protein n=1 Tax=Microbacterium sp. cf332 TaxID=1761804 RepID=UPI000B886231|nr:ROK family protein [Microbacterium sp. cf332]
MRIGVDVGGTKILAVAVDDAGLESGRVRRPTGWGGEAVADGIADVVRELAGDRTDVSIGLGVPGQIVPGSGVVEHALNLGIERFDLAGALVERVGIRPVVDNDVRFAAVGARSARPGAGSLAYLNLGTGVAAGIVDETGPRRGARGAAGEIGHVPVDPSGPLCRCGQRGCIEALAGGSAVAERWGRPDALPVRAVFDAADAADPRAAALRDDLVRGVAAAVRLLVLATDVDVVVLGGGIAALGERLLDPVCDELRESSAASGFLLSLRLAERVELVPRGMPVGAVGAALGSGAAVSGGARATLAALDGVDAHAVR